VEALAVLMEEDHGVMMARNVLCNMLRRLHRFTLGLATVKGFGPEEYSHPREPTF
jgi:hypothetical protein